MIEGREIRAKAGTAVRDTLAHYSLLDAVNFDLTILPVLCISVLRLIPNAEEEFSLCWAS